MTTVSETTAQVFGFGASSHLQHAKIANNGYVWKLGTLQTIVKKKKQQTWRFTSGFKATLHSKW